MSREKKARLGRGLEALMGEYLSEETPPDSGEVRTLPLDSIRPNPFQPRKEFAREELDELAQRAIA